MWKWCESKGRTKSINNYTFTNDHNKCVFEKRRTVPTMQLFAVFSDDKLLLESAFNKKRE